MKIIIKTHCGVGGRCSRRQFAGGNNGRTTILNQLDELAIQVRLILDCVSHRDLLAVIDNESVVDVWVLRLAVVAPDDNVLDGRNRCLGLARNLCHCVENNEKILK
jgi:hypothetical protein